MGSSRAGEKIITQMYFDNLTDSFTLRSAHDEVTVVDAFKRSRLVVIADLLDLYS